MICPNCGFDNLPGSEHCSHCLHDLTQLDRPVSRDRVERSLMEDSVSVLHPPKAVTVSADATVGEAVGVMLDRDIGAVCLAVLRRDGFISLDAGTEPGTLTTPRCTLPAGAGRLFVNVDARGGEFRAEIENDKGQVVAQSAIVRADAPRQAITWEQGDLAGLAGQRVALRFRLRNARFYSYWFEP